MRLRNARRRVRLAAVYLILFAWPIMPRRFRAWAFLNDDMP